MTVITQIRETAYFVDIVILHVRVVELLNMSVKTRGGILSGPLNLVQNRRVRRVYGPLTKTCAASIT